jgi:hypothetical protein
MIRASRATALAVPFGSHFLIGWSQPDLRPTYAALREYTE